VGDQDEHPPDAVVLKSRNGMLRRPVSLSLRTWRLGVRALALAALEQLDVRVGLVG
jgi:hypothetical protein